MTIHWLDVAIVAAYMAATVVLGLWIGRKQRGYSDYLVGGRDLPWWAVLGSTVATETSTATFLGVPAIAYAATGNLTFLQLTFGYIAGRVLVAVFLLPHYFRGNLFTAYEVLDQRFGGRAKQAASVMFLFARNLGDGLRLFLTAIVLEQVAGLNLPVCIAIVGAATIVYTFFGGIKAVVWNDCIQFTVYMIGGVLAGILILNAIPEGWGGLRDYANECDKFVLFDFSWDITKSFTFWAGLVGGATLTLGTHGTDQMMVQRFLCARGQRDAGRAVVLSGVVVFAQFALFLLLGVGLACFYHHFPPATEFRSNDQVFATFIVTEMPVGVTGITLAAVFSAAMSTLSSSLNSSASSLVNDLYLPAKNFSSDSPQAFRATRWCTVWFGIVQIAVGIVASYFSRSVVNDALAIGSVTAGVLVGVFALGVLTERATQTGAVAGLLMGVGAVAAVKFTTEIAWTWYALIGAATTFTTGIAVSCLGKEEG